MLRRLLHRRRLHGLLRLWPRLGLWWYLRLWLRGYLGRGLGMYLRLPILGRYDRSRRFRRLGQVHLFKQRLPLDNGSFFLERSRNGGFLFGGRWCGTSRWNRGLRSAPFRGNGDILSGNAGRKRNDCHETGRPGKKSPRCRSLHGNPYHDRFPFSIIAQSPQGALPSPAQRPYSPLRVAG